LGRFCGLSGKIGIPSGKPGFYDRPLLEGRNTSFFNKVSKKIERMDLHP
jgi:hypothetical protein